MKPIRLLLPFVFVFSALLMVWYDGMKNEGVEDEIDFEIEIQIT